MTNGHGDHLETEQKYDADADFVLPKLGSLPDLDPLLYQRVAPLVTVYSYAAMNHAFARVGGQHYDKANADLANVRSATFFRQHLS